jgi:FlaA1/EpsC-like NDP-sugar epimerase
MRFHQPSQAKTLMGLALRHRRILIVALHIAIVVASNYLAFLLRFDGSIPRDPMRMWTHSLLFLVVVRAAVFLPFRLYQGLWRYVSIWDARNIVGAVAASSLIFWVVERWIVGETGYPRSIYILDALVLTMLLGGVRLGRRIAREIGQEEGKKGVLVYGAGDAGERIVRDMHNNPSYQFRPVGFVDDDGTKHRMRIHGVPVLGGRDRLPQIIAETQPKEILIAIPRADAATRRGIVRALEPYKVPISTLPDLGELLNRKVGVEQIRDLAVEDLLERDPIDLDKAPVQRLIRGQRVLVTGAGGSIGSELCRQILDLEPSELVLLERYENALFVIAGELARRHPTAAVIPAIADICDPNRVAEVLAKHRPDIVFHAAAHKHVPLMELNPCEAVKNNVLGTRCLARAAARFRVPRFVMISTDKAVNPTSIMGATKRVAEFIVQDMNFRASTAFITVRFGNVLNSNGSVVPTFLEQIRRGGPVTVTHPEMRRYFMLIPEAAALVLHAAALGEGGEVYVLQMGEQVKLLDMARNLIRLAGLVLEQDISIAFTGLRAGEKLSEELIGDDEVVEASGMTKIIRVRPKAAPADLDRCVSELGRAAARGSTASVVNQLKAIVPTFSPQPLSAFFRPGTRVPRAALAEEARLQAASDAGAAEAPTQASLFPSSAQAPST